MQELDKIVNLDDYPIHNPNKNIFKKIKKIKTKLKLRTTDAIIS